MWNPFWKENKNIIGYTNIDWLFDGPEKTTVQAFRSLQNASVTVLGSMAAFIKTDDEIKELVMGCLLNETL